MASENRNFLELYEPYIRHDWKIHYFAYDALKVEYKAQKEMSVPKVLMLDLLVLNDVKRVDFFLSAVLADIERELAFLEQETSTDHSIELVVRQMYERCIDCEKFYDLNLFAIMKTIKKMCKLPQPQDVYFKSEAKDFVESTFKQRINSALALKSRCIELYTSKFCRNYPSLGNGELKFVKNKERVSPHTPILYAFKFGVSAAVILLITVDAYLGQQSQFWFWNNPGLYVYTTVGNMLVFRITWATNLIMWNRFGVNYIPIFQFPDNKPNMTIVVNHISTQMLLFSLNLLLYYEANKGSSVLGSIAFFRSGFPVILVLMYLIYEVWEYSLHGNTYRLSRGVFSIQSLINCCIVPFAKVTFRDNYVANTLTSFTKVFADFFHASCWIVCGAFLHSSADQTVESFGAGPNFSCTGYNMNLVIMTFQLVPQWMRFGQNMRQWRDTKQSRYPWNMFKYALAMLVILYGHFHEQEDVGSFILVGSVALYKWWWDVVMNWGLFDSETFKLQYLLNTEQVPAMSDTTQPWSVFGLRKNLLFPYSSLYYVCIVGNLVLRFLWVMSLLPPSMSRSFVGPKLSFFLAAMEIVRRAMWGLLKTEYEHIKYALARKPGYYFRRSLLEAHVTNAAHSPRQSAAYSPGGEENIIDIEAQLEDQEVPTITRFKPTSERLTLSGNGSVSKIAANTSGKEDGEATGGQYEVRLVQYDSDDDSDSDKGGKILPGEGEDITIWNSRDEDPKDK